MKASSETPIRLHASAGYAPAASLKLCAGGLSARVALREHPRGTPPRPH